MAAILLFWTRNWGEGTRENKMLGRRRYSEVEGLKRKKRSLEQLLRILQKQRYLISMHVFLLTQ